MKSLLWLIVVLGLISFPTISFPTVMAIPDEYNLSSGFTQQFLSNPNEILLSPKISCAEDSSGVLQHCGLIYYDNSSNNVVFYFSTNKFATFTAYNVVSVDFSSFENFTAITSQFSMPMDIRWDSSTNLYQIAVRNKIYVFNPSTSTISTLITYTYDSKRMNSIIGFLNDSSVLVLHVDDNNVGSNGQCAQATGRLAVNTFTASGTGTECVTAFGSLGSLTAAQSLSSVDASGFSGKSGSTTLYKVDYKWVANSPASGTTTSLGNYPQTVDLPDYWDNSNIIARNSTGSGKGVFKTSTTDLSTFGSRGLYYSMSTGETVNQQDGYSGTGVQSIVYINNTVGRNVLQIFIRQFVPVTVFNALLSWNNQQTTTVNATVIFSCSGYNQTASGSLLSMKTPCATTSATIYSSNIPASFSFNFSSLSCSSVLLTTLFSTKSSVLYKVVDSISRNSIPSAVVTIGSTTGTTNNNGEATLSITPISNTNINKTESNCRIDVSPTFRNSDLIIYTTSIVASGYQTFIDIGSTFPRRLNVKIMPLDLIGTRAIVHLYTLDSGEIFPSNIIVRASASNQVPVIIDGNSFINQSIWYKVPATYFFANTSSSTFNATFNITMGNNKTYETSVTLSINTFNDVIIFTDYGAVNGYCQTNTDCRKSFCSTETFTSFVTCSNNQCIYQPQQCNDATLCSNNYGCFDFKTTQTCNDDSNCQSECVGDYTSKTAFCDSGFCIQKLISCQGTVFNQSSTANNCNNSTGLCKFTDACKKIGSSLTPLTILEIQSKEGLVNQIVQRIGIGGLLGLIGVGSSNGTILLDKTISCGFGNTGNFQSANGQNIEYVQTGQRACISGISLPKKDGFTYITVPNNWLTKIDTSNNIIFNDAVVSCAADLTCKLDVQFCQFGCLNGQCVGSPASSKTGNSEISRTIGSLIFGFFPDDTSKMWLFFMGLIAFMLLGAGLTRQPVIGLGGGLGWTVVSIFTYLPLIIGAPVALLMGLILAFMSARYFTHGTTGAG